MKGRQFKYSIAHIHSDSFWNTEHPSPWHHRSSLANIQTISFKIIWICIDNSDMYQPTIYNKPLILGSTLTISVEISFNYKYYIHCKSRSHFVSGLKRLYQSEKRVNLELQTWLYYLKLKVGYMHYKVFASLKRPIKIKIKSKTFGHIKEKLVAG